VLAEAARAVASVAFDGRSVDEVLRHAESSSHRSALKAVALGSLRWYLRLSPAVDSLLSNPKGIASPIRALLVVTAHQIEYSRNAPELTVHAAVDATRILGQGRASGLVNAVLRRFVSDRTALLARVDQRLPGRTAHPAWLVDSLAGAWPDRYQQLLDANNEHPPMVLRVDLSRTTRGDYLRELETVGITANAPDWVDSALYLSHPVNVEALPGFHEGKVSVQDAGAQLAAPLLDARPGMRVLDACAAPGGKTGHLLELTPGLGELLAVDVDAGRAGRIEENLSRLHRTATVRVADVGDPDALTDQAPFDRILIDAPCSSTGVIRRHPDIKLLRRPTDIAAFAATQHRILASAYRWLAPGGRLVYCTCSVLPAENEQVVARFLESEPSARVAATPPGVALPPGHVQRKAGIQLLPGSEAGTDGFYYACLEKTTAGT
jgi:16S rRNA (cytosine967-C5)-methyltransferase